MVRFGIVGCGVVGLTTAAALQERFPNSEFILVGAAQGSDLVSNGAAGIFRPDPALLPGMTCCNADVPCTDCAFSRWCSRSRAYLWDLACSLDAENAGAFFLPLYNVYENLPSRPPYITTICGGSRIIEKDELLSLGFNEGLNFGYSYTTCMVECRYYTSYLLSSIQKNATLPVLLSVGQSVQFQSIQEVHKWALTNKVDVIVNCTGLGASTLCGDRHLIPLRGRLVRVGAPWMKFGFFGPHDTYAYPGRESIILGGFREPLPCPLDKPLRPEDTGSSIEASKNILNRVKDLWRGPLSQSTIIEEWTGLRPYRPIIRLELNWLGANGSSGDCSGADVIPIVHNYGHGSMGVGLSWGTALDAVDLVDQALKRGAGASKQPVFAPGLEKLALA